MLTTKAIKLFELSTGVLCYFMEYKVLHDFGLDNSIRYDTKSTSNKRKPTKIVPHPIKTCAANKAIKKVKRQLAKWDRII